MTGRSFGSGRGGATWPTILLALSLFLCGALASTLFVTLRGAGTAVSQSRPGGASSYVRAVSEDGDPKGSRPGGSGDARTFDRAESSSSREGGAALGSGEEITRDRRNAIVLAAEKAGSAVVTVGVTQTRLVRRQRGYVDPFDLFFNRYLPGVVYEQKIPGIGSGFVVDPTGIILTNEHVVRDASEIKVILSDGRTMDARLLGADPNYDVAVLKVEEENLPYAQVGNSDDLVVGEWAIAIGNPFGFYLNDHQPTVTVGVISAIHRDVKGEEESAAIYKDMIQTDAAINPGNSGGPLVNSNGEVIGVNTFIFTQGGGSLGIGFAIPINTAVRVARDVARYGRARPVWIGIYAQAISPWVAVQLGLRDANGLLASRVEAGSPADRAGIHEMDVIREVNGKVVSNPQEAIRTIFGAQVGDVVTFTVERQGKSLRIPVKIEAPPGAARS